jgi:hypothetical protein
VFSEVGKMRLLVGFVLLCVCGAAYAGALVQDPIVFCPPASPGAKIDGVLDEVFWQIPAGIPKFVNLSGRTPKEATQAWAAFGRDGAYFAFECQQAQMSPTNSAQSKEVWKDDSVEVFVDSSGNRKDYAHFILSAAGAKMHERGEGMGKLDRAAQLEWQGAAKVDSGKWTAEFFIPYKTLGIVYAEGSVLRANLCRNNAVTGESSCWTTLFGDFHQPLGFGNLVMGVPIANVKFSADAGEKLNVGAAKVRVSCENNSKSDITVVPTLYPSGKKLSSGKPLVVPAGKSLNADLPVSFDQPGRINLRLAAVDSATGKQIVESSFGASVTQAPPKPVGGVIASDSWGTLWHCVSTFKVMRDTPPPANKAQGVQISAARNEHEPFQLVLRPAKTLSGVKVTPRTLVGPGGAKLPAWAISVRSVEYVSVIEPTSWDVEPGDYPDPLPEFTSVNAPRGVNTPIWITVNVPPKTAPGLYKGVIDISASGMKTLSVPLSVKVRNFELPTVSTLRTAFGCSMDRVAQYQGMSTTDDWRKLVDLYNTDFWRHRVSPYRPWEAYRIKGSVENGRLKLDFSDFDIAIQKFFPMFNSFMLPGFGMGDTAGMDFGDNYEQLKIEYMRAVTEHLAAKGQIAKGYNYIMDEPTEDQYKAVREAAELCRMADQRIKVLLTEQVEDALVGSVDIWVPVLPAYDEARSKARQAKGEEVWWYVCCGPHHPYPNYFIDYPAIDHRILPWITWRYGVNGILYWDTTYWRDNPWETAMSYTLDGKGKWGNGDGKLLYPAVRKPSDKPVAKGPVPSIRWEMIREGIEDYDYFRILQDRLNTHQGKSTPEVLKAQEALKLVESCATSRTEYARDPAKIESVRAKVADAIEGLK